MINMDGPTTSDHGFSGNIGKLLPKVTSLPGKKKFTKGIIGPDLVSLPEDVVGDLSSDQKYGYNMVKAIRSGEVSEELLQAAIGPLNHSRWLTFANRMLRLYVSEHNLDDDDTATLLLIVQFIVGQYYPMWFRIKVHHSWLCGPQHVLSQVECLRQQPKVIQDNVLKYVVSSSWFGHLEAILQTLLTSDQEEDKHFAVKKILELRQKSDSPDKGNTSVRSYKTPESLNLQANSIKELIDWETETVLEPVLTCCLLPDEIRQFLDKPMTVPYFPAHGQCFERAVKLVTEASQQVFGWNKRDGYIRVRNKHRQKFQSFDSKQAVKAE